MRPTQASEALSGPKILPGPRELRENCKLERLGLTSMGPLTLVNFDRVVRDPLHPDRILQPYDSGDHLHPSPAGYKAMGEAIPLSLFAQ